MYKIKTFIAIILIITISAGIIGCSHAQPSGTTAAQPVGTVTRAVNLMANITPGQTDGKSADSVFNESMARFSVELFKKSIANDKNSLISPLSVMLALAMTANGADGETLAQMERLLGGGIKLSELNKYLFSYADGLPSTEKTKLNIANSIWFRDDKDKLYVEPDFLQKNADYYGAAAFRSVFDAQATKEINDWVKTNTDGMIDEIIGKIETDVMLLLINAIAFDAEWLNPYYDHNVRKDSFTDINGNKQNVDFMNSMERLYLDDGMATGFIKPYFGEYSFVALLPNEDVPIEKYIESLTGERFMETLGNYIITGVEASMPKFKYDYEIELNDTLKELGMPDAFSLNADFHNMGAVKDGFLYISEVLHKTFISVDELGTKAGAATMVVMASGSPPPQTENKIVKLDRPFVFAIIDSAINLPIFIGTVLTAA